MSFDTALLNLVGAGLAVVGSRQLTMADRLLVQSDPVALIEFLTRAGQGRRIAALAQAAAGGLVGRYRADPARVVRHIQWVATLMPDHGLSRNSATQAAWQQAQAACALADRRHAAETGSAAAPDNGQMARACEALAGGILAASERC